MTGTTSAARTRVALLQKLDGLSLELRSWREHSRAGERFHKHRPQISRLVGQMGGFLAALRSELKSGPDEILGRLDDVILEGHRVWDFFRRKLLLRAVDDFQLPLTVADELAWACYRPARVRARAATRDLPGLREPPLVFFDDECTPFVITRGRHYGSELASPVNNKILQRMVNYLPVPVVGIPWSNARHLPEMLVIAHEIGHIVEDDFMLANDIDAAVAAACEEAALTREEHSQWQRWSRELFADVYACVAVGPAYAETLADLLAYESGVSDLYPPRAVRLGVNAAALRCCGFDVEVPGGVEDGVAREVAAALLAGPYSIFGPGATLQSILCFSADDHSRAQQHATQILRRRFTLPRDVRVLLAATRIAFVTDPKKYRQSQVHDFAVDLAQRVVDRGTRAAGTAETRRHEDDPERGRQLFELVLQMMAKGGEA